MQEILSSDKPILWLNSDNQSSLVVIFKALVLVSYSTVVLYIGIMKVWDFLSQNITPKPA